MPNEEKLPPQNLEAEESVLGSILIDNDAIVKVADLISSEDFYLPQHRQIYEAMIDLYTPHPQIKSYRYQDESRRKASAL